MTRDDIRKLLWDAANSLRIHVDAATYKHPVLGLIFLKYVSDRFELRRRNLAKWARDPESEYFVGEDEAEYIIDDRDAYDEAHPLVGGGGGDVDADGNPIKLQMAGSGASDE